MCPPRERRPTADRGRPFLGVHWWSVIRKPSDRGRRTSRHRFRSQLTLLKCDRRLDQDLSAHSFFFCCPVRCMCCVSGISGHKSLYSIEGSQAKMSTARRFQGARSRRYSVSAMQRNAESGVQGHLQPFRFCLNTGSKGPATFHLGNRRRNIRSQWSRGRRNGKRLNSRGPNLPRARREYGAGPNHTGRTLPAFPL